MGDMLKLVCWVVTRLFRSRASLEAEILMLRPQLNVLQRKAPKRLVFNNSDRLVFASLYRLAPGILNALVIKPEGHRLASGRVSLVLAMEVALLRRQTESLSILCS